MSEREPDPLILAGELLAAEAAYQAAAHRYEAEGTDESRGVLVEAEERLVALKELVELVSRGKVDH